VLGLLIFIFLIRLLWISRVEGWNLSWWRNTLIQEISLLFNRLRMSKYKGQLFRNLRYLFFSITLLTFAILAFTGIIPVLILNEHMVGIFLIIHVTIAPVFAIGLALTALFWAHFQQFSNSDLELLKTVQAQNKISHLEYHAQTYWPKILFWLFLTLSIPASLSMIISMFPFFGTDGQNTMLNIHRYTTLGLLIIAFFYTDFKLISSSKRAK
jgi:hypothetical protein